MTTPKATKKSGYAYATEKLAKKEEELEKTQVVMGGTMNLLAKNTEQRNNAQADASYLNKQLTSANNAKHSQFFTLMGRLVKYEPSAFDEVLPYALENGCFWECDSKELGVYSVIGDYTTKTTKKTYKAHFTIYNRFLTKCEKEDEAPISYRGYFLMQNYPDKFEVDRTKTEYKTIKDFIKIKSAPEPIPEPDPIVIPVCDWVMYQDGDLKCKHFGDKFQLKIHYNSIYIVNPDTDEVINHDFPILNPERYGVDTTNIDWNAFIKLGSETYWNKERHQNIWVKKDYDTTPKRKVAKNKIWEANPSAENYIHAFGFTKV
jgi:hypothetical protein